MQALPVPAGKEGDQRRGVCAERLGDLEQEKTEGRNLWGTKKACAIHQKSPQSS